MTRFSLVGQRTAGKRTTACLTALVALTLAGCATRPLSTDTQRAGSAVPPDLPGDAVPRPEARSRYGNGPLYEVFGQRYQVLDSSYGYVEQGVASWYGKKFHGRLTSSREPYDMYAMTAAHKSLPLPTYVEVRNLSNGRSVVVRVNDRGPFVKNRLIDLSYAAAQKLGIVRDGTGMVEVRAISFDPPPEEQQLVRTSPAAPAPATGNETLPGNPPANRQPAQPMTVARSPEVPGEADQPSPPAVKTSEPPGRQATGRTVYLQVGAFGSLDNAERRHQLLEDNGIRPAFVHREADREPALYRVRIGPLSGVEHYDEMVEELSRIGIQSSHLVSE